MNNVYVLTIECHYYGENNYKILKCYGKKDKAEKELKKLNNILSKIQSETDKIDTELSEENYDIEIEKYYKKLNDYFELYPELFFDEVSPCHKILLEEVELI